MGSSLHYRQPKCGVSQSMFASVDLSMKNRMQKTRAL